MTLLLVETAPAPSRPTPAPPPATATPAASVAQPTTPPAPTGAPAPDPGKAPSAPTAAQIPPPLDGSGLDTGKVEAATSEARAVPAAQIEGVRPRSAQPDTQVLEAVVPVRLVARNMMGRRFRLVEARFVLGGTELARLSAPAGQEVDLSAPLMVLPLRRGEHALTITLVFQGRKVGFFSYLNNYRYRVESTYSFYLEQTEQQPVIEVVAREQGGVMVPLERRPTLEISAALSAGVTPMGGVNHGTQVTVVR
jgi:hypothetical protein